MVTRLPCNCLPNVPVLGLHSAAELIDIARHPYVHHDRLGCCWDGVVARAAASACVDMLERVLEAVK